jgi:hypothetical protein
MIPPKTSAASFPCQPRPKAGRFAIGALLLASVAASAQAPDPAPSRAPSGGGGNSGSPASTTKPKQPTGFLGKDVPVVDPGTEVATWDGKSWNLGNNRAVEARVEKYLNAPEETSDDAKNYQKIITEMMTLLAPSQISPANLDACFRMLPYASRYEIDAHLCDAIADAVATVWYAKSEQAHLTASVVSMDEERKMQEWNLKQASDATHIDAPKIRMKNGGGIIASPPSPKDSAVVVQRTAHLTELLAKIKGKEAKNELTEFKTKVEYQTLIVQLFMQRRFQHVLVATRFYRALFNDGDSKMTVGRDLGEVYTRTTGSAPTVSTLDSLANEAIRDINEGIKSFEFLLEQHELDSGTKRLIETFAVGEYMPSVRLLARSKKRQALEMMKKGNELISSVEVKDYTRAETLVNELEKIAKDFNTSKPRAAIETTRRMARIHIGKAKVAATAGDKATVDSELAEAAELWPLNPELDTATAKLFNAGDVQQAALRDFSQLYGQKNFRQIYINSARFIAASVDQPEVAEQLKTVMENMKIIEAAILRAEEMRRQSNFAGAWESVEKIASQFPDDSVLNQIRADLTTQAADFVHTLRNAQELEKKDQVGASLCWFLRSQKMYPASDFSREGVDRMKKKILPES